MPTTWSCPLKTNPEIKMSYVLPRLETKKDIDAAIKGTEDKVLVLRFGRESDIVCMQLDEIVGASFLS